MGVTSIDTTPRKNGQIFETDAIPFLLLNCDCRLWCYVRRWGKRAEMRARISIALCFLFFSGCVAAPSKPELLSEEMQQIDDAAKVVPQKWQACKKDKDCGEVEIGCTSCCETASMNKTYAKNWARNRESTCEYYRGPICDCYKPEYKAVCKEGECSLQVEDKT